jgi:hypothetical protein
VALASFETRILDVLQKLTDALHRSWSSLLEGRVDSSLEVLAGSVAFP